MKSIKFRPLVPVITFFLIALALSAWVWWVTNERAASAQSRKENLEMAHAAARNKLRQSDAERNLILAHLSTFKHYERRGITGGGNRLAWLEAAHEANRSAGLYGMHYALDAATPVPGSPEMERTLMKLRMPLLTESDLPAFLAALAARNTGLFWTKSCTLIRTGNLQPAMANQPGLESECEFYWYSIKKKGDS
jgi:hypothetical protein